MVTAQQLPNAAKQLKVQTGEIQYTLSLPAAIGSCCVVTRVEGSSSTIRSVPTWQRIWLQLVLCFARCTFAFSKRKTLSTHNSNVKWCLPYTSSVITHMPTCTRRFRYLGSKVMRNIICTYRAEGEPGNEASRVHDEDIYIIIV